MEFNLAKGLGGLAVVILAYILLVKVVTPFYNWLQKEMNKKRL